jgi:hypothetical protein
MALCISQLELPISQFVIFGGKIISKFPLPYSRGRKQSDILGKKHGLNLISQARTGEKSDPRQASPPLFVAVVDFCKMIASLHG